jgi:hypothetical protein
VAPFGSEFFEEPVELAMTAPFGYVEDPAGVVVGDDGQILVAPFIGDFVDAEVEHVIETRIVEVVVNNTFYD